MTTPNALTTATTGTAAAAASLSVAHTTISGTNTLLVASIVYSGGAAMTMSATWNGSSMTSLGKQTYSASGTDYSEIFYILAPAVTTANVVFTPSANATMAGVVQQWQNVNQSTPWGAVTTGEQTSANTTFSLSSIAAAANDTVFGAAAAYSAGSWTFTFGDTDRGKVENGGTADSIAAQSKTATGSSETLTWNAPGFTPVWWGVAASMKQDGAGSSPVLMGQCVC